MTDDDKHCRHNWEYVGDVGEEDGGDGEVEKGGEKVKADDESVFAEEGDCC